MIDPAPSLKGQTRIIEPAWARDDDEAGRIGRGAAVVIIAGLSLLAWGVVVGLPIILGRAL